MKSQIIPKLLMPNTSFIKKQGRKLPLDTPKRMIARREREGEREKER